MGKGISTQILFEPNMLFRWKKNASLRNTANKHRIVNVISTELKKVGCNGFDDANIGYYKVSFSKFLETSYNCNWLEQGFTCAIVVSCRR